jgi:ketosteroid isomerase-like protein
MVRRVLLVALVLLGVAPRLPADEAPDAIVARLEGERFVAQQKADAGALDRLLAPDLTYAHSTGKVDTKASFIESIRTGAIRYVAIEAPEDQRVRVYDSTAIVTGHCRMTIGATGQEQKIHLRFTDVWAKRAGVWQMVAWHSTRLAEP